MERLTSFPGSLQWKAGEGLGTRLIIDLVIKPLKIDVNVMCALQTLPRYSTSSFQMMWTQSRCRLIQFQTAHTVLLYPFKTPLYVYACDGWDSRGEGNIHTLVHFRLLSLHKKLRMAKGRRGREGRGGKERGGEYMSRFISHCMGMG